MEIWRWRGWGSTFKNRSWIITSWNSIGAEWYIVVARILRDLEYDDSLKIRTFCACKNLWSATKATIHGFLRCANLHMNVYTRKLFILAVRLLTSFYGLYDIWTDSFCQSHMRITFTDKNNYTPQEAIFTQNKKFLLL